jgi:riboflavin kinase/FMN adenylyltransferase
MAVRIVGRVAHGLGRGRQLGFPTANVQPVPGSAAPPPGVWAGWIRWAGQGWQPAVVNVGSQPTFGGASVAVEAHVIGFDGDLYETDVELRLAHRLRDEHRFASAEALAAQIETDTLQARALLGGSGEAGKPTEGEQ